MSRKIRFGKKKSKVTLIDSFVNSLSKHPVTFYLGGGFAGAILARSAFNYYKQHPEIAEFFKERLDVVESKFDEISSVISGSTKASDVGKRRGRRSASSKEDVAMKH